MGEESKLVLENPKKILEDWKSQLKQKQAEEKKKREERLKKEQKIANFRRYNIKHRSNLAGRSKPSNINLPTKPIYANAASMRARGWHPKSIRIIERFAYKKCPYGCICNKCQPPVENVSQDSPEKENCFKVPNVREWLRCRILAKRRRNDKEKETA